MADVDILCVVDGQSLYEHMLINDIKTSENDRYTLFESRGSGDSPRFNIAKYCRMITRDGSAEIYPGGRAQGGLSTNAHHDLVVRAKVDDIIRWRAVSLTADERRDGYRVDITGFHGIDHELCDQPQPLAGHVDVWQTIARKAGGPDSYWLYFKVTAWDETVAYFDWDPGIHITEK